LRCKCGLERCRCSSMGSDSAVQAHNATGAQEGGTSGTPRTRARDRRLAKDVHRRTAQTWTSILSSIQAVMSSACRPCSASSAYRLKVHIMTKGQPCRPSERPCYDLVGEDVPLPATRPSSGVHSPRPLVGFQSPGLLQPASESRRSAARTSKVGRRQTEPENRAQG
jgi:hypothetical protein